MILKSITYWAIARILLFPRLIFDGVTSAFRASFSHLITLIPGPWAQGSGGAETPPGNAIERDTGRVPDQGPGDGRGIEMYVYTHHLWYDLSFEFLCVLF